MRRRRQYLSAALSRNEVNRDYAYNRGLFQRIRHGGYQLAPDLSLRVRENGEERWVPIAQRLNLSLLLESAREPGWLHLSRLVDGPDAPLRVPIIAERRYAELQRKAAAQQQAREEQARLAAEREREHLRQRMENAQRLAQIAANHTRGGTAGSTLGHARRQTPGTGARPGAAQEAVVKRDDGNRIQRKWAHDCLPERASATAAGGRFLLRLSVRRQRRSESDAVGLQND
jgi:hypothetical protein